MLIYHCSYSITKFKTCIFLQLCLELNYLINLTWPFTAVFIFISVYTFWSNKCKSVDTSQVDLLLKNKYKI